MGYYKIRSLQSDGVEAVTPVTAVSADEAARGSAIPADEIISIARDWSREVSELSRWVSLSPYHQATLMSSLSAAAISGQSLDHVFDDFLATSAALRRKRDEVMDHDQVADRLRALNCDRQACLLVETGDANSELGDALYRAAQELMYRKKLVGELKFALAVPAAAFLMSLSAIIGLPFLFIPVVRDVRAAGLDVPTGLCTAIMNTIYEVAGGAWPLFLVSALVIWFYRGPIWQVISKAGPLSVFNEYFGSLRALGFMTLFSPLYRRGKPEETILELQLQYTKGAGRRIYRDMLEKVREGEEFSKTIRATEWPLVFVRGMSGLETVRIEAREQKLTMTQNLLVERVNGLQGQISKVLYVISTVVMIAGLTVVFFGAFMPLQQASPA